MLLKLFRALMPQDDVFVPLFSAHASKGLEAARQFALVVANPSDSEAYEALRRIEHEADDAARATTQAIHQVFVTPFDRSEILELSSGLDDIVDFMKDAARQIRLYKVDPTAEMISMADCAIRACEQLQAGVPGLSSIQKNAPALKAMCDAVDAIESEADRALEVGLQALFAGDASPGAKLMVERVYQRIEDVVDRCEDVADLVQGIVIEQV